MVVIKYYTDGCAKFIVFEKPKCDDCGCSSSDFDTLLQTLANADLFTIVSDTGESIVQFDE